MENNQEAKALGAMSLIMELEEKVRGKNRLIEDLKHEVATLKLQLIGSLTVKNEYWWYGALVGVVGTAVTDLLYHWWK